jgi:hypothetical protein
MILQLNAALLRLVERCKVSFESVKIWKRAACKQMHCPLMEAKAHEIPLVCKN